MPTIYSTLTEDQLYTKWNVTPDKNTPIAEVLIKGGHGKINSKTLITPYGVGTEVTDEQLKILESIESFRKHKEAGYITILAQKTDPEKVAVDMNQNDPSKQLSEADFKDNPPKSNKKKRG